ncbi:MAG TPA: hypothetical protein VHP37_32405 [Burkholderiales bacterium]|nr:hypothetical protein [Burkholderiales bacterium]
MNRVGSNIYVSTAIYWQMPSPQAFSEQVAWTLAKGRWALIRIPHDSVPGITSALEMALSHVHYDNEKLARLHIDDGMNVPMEVGTVFERKHMHAIDLAKQSNGVSSVILEYSGDSASRNCRQYLVDFEAACRSTNNITNGTRLLVLSRQPLHDLRTPKASSVQDIVFSGALSYREMRAYVYMRTDRIGPGTIPLVPALIAEFAGYDPLLAEQLMALPLEALLNLPHPLDALLALDTHRWRAGQWSAGAVAEIDGRTYRHALYDQYLATHPGPEQDTAITALKRRYWQACIQAVMPWLELRRPLVMSILKPSVQRFLQSTGEKLYNRSDRPDYEIDIEDLEYNRIVGLVYKQNLRIAADAEAQLAFKVCCLAKKLRDSLAHIRCPGPRDLVDLAEAMDYLVPEVA